MGRKGLDTMRTIRIGKLKVLRQSLAECTSLDELRASLGHLADQTGVAHISYTSVAIGEAALNLTTQPVEPTGPGAGQARAAAQIVSHNILPVADWLPDPDRAMRSRADRSEPLTEYSWGDERRDQVLIIPLHGPHGLSAVLRVTDSRSDAGWEFFLGLWQDELWLMGLELHARVLAVTGALKDKQDLSPRERETIAVLASGGNRAEVGKKLGISEHTVRDHIVSARNKLGARSTMHAVALAVSQGLADR